MAKKLKKTSSSSSSDFPLDILETILSKLSLSSVKCLLRFKTVSKSWNAVISDPLFVQNHFQSTNSPDNNLFLRMHRSSDKGNFSLIKFEGQKARVVEAALEKPYFSKVLCECNGVILLTDSSNKNGKYVLWNPSNQWQMYFKCPYDKLNRYKVNHGIFYDPITHDFKVVMIVRKNLAVYSCNNNSWTKKKSRTRYAGVCSGIFVDGATFWLLEDNKRRQLIVYFDSKTDELKNLSKPNELNGDGNIMRIYCIASLRGRLCLYSTYERRVKIWIKDEGVFEDNCWNEFITIESMRPWDNNWLFCGPVCYVGNKIVIRLNQKRFAYYCPSEKKRECFEDIDMYGCKIVPYRNSLYFPGRKGGNIGRPRGAMAPKRL